MWRYETTFFGPVNIDSEDERRNFHIIFESTDRSFTKKVCEVWTKDTSISAQVSYASKAFGHGFVKELEKKESEDNLIVIEIQIYLMPHSDTIEQDNEFEAMLGGCNVFIRTNEGGGTLRAQADTLGQHKPSNIMEKEESPRAQIVKALFARQGADELMGEGAIRDLNLECVRLLNAQQRTTLANWLNEGPGRVHFQQAPPGTGKTRSAAACVAAIIHLRPDSAILATAAANLPVSKLVQETSRTLPEQDMVAFFSGIAKVRYNEHVAQLENHVLSAKISREAFQRRLNNLEVREVEQYLEMVDTRPRQCAERKVGQVLQEKDFKNVAFGTIHMALGIPGAHSKTSHLVVDECTQLSYVALIHMVCQMPKLSSVLLTGDKRQIGVHVKDLPDILHEGYGLETLTEEIDHCSRISKTWLELCYRSHPAITMCFDFASYRQFNEVVKPAVTEAERSGLTTLGINLPVVNVPLILMNIQGQTQVDLASFSVMNPDQTVAALRVVEVLERRDPGRTVIICLYSFQAECLRKVLKENRLDVPVHTIDAYQAQESKFVVLVTTKTTTPGASARPTASEFIKDSRRTTVAISRAQHGMVVIADFEAISEGEVWKRFTDEAQRHTPIVNDKYLEVMEIENPTRGVGGILQDKSGWTLQAPRVGGNGQQKQEEGRRERGSRKCTRCGAHGHLTRDCRR